MKFLAFLNNNAAGNIYFCMTHSIFHYAVLESSCTMWSFDWGRPEGLGNNLKFIYYDDILTIPTISILLLIICNIYFCKEARVYSCVTMKLLILLEDLGNAWAISYTFPFLLDIDLQVFMFTWCWRFQRCEAGLLHHICELLFLTLAVCSWDYLPMFPFISSFGRGFCVNIL